jgi:hypothetical protein
MDDPEASDPSIFRRILCGFDGTPASLIAVRHALRLQDEDGEVQLTAAAHVAKAAHADTAAPHAAELLQAEAETTLAEARAIAPSAIPKLVNGDPVAVLLERLSRRLWLQSAPRETRPRTVVAGVDGSAASAIAFGVARSVAGRFRARRRAMASTKDQLDHGAAQEIAPELEVLAAPLRLLDRARRL